MSWAARHALRLALCFGLGALAVHAAAAAPQVKTGGGSIEGLQNGNLVTLMGVPYAAPPVGALRWRAPQPAPSWEGVRRADSVGGACSQKAGMSLEGGGDTGPTSEDCLTVNVWTPRPEPGARLPVLVWFHGGALVFGSGGLAL